MKNKSFSIIASLFILLVFGILYLTQMPRWVSKDVALNTFSTDRALTHIKKIANQPHFIGSANHEKVSEYLISELKKMGIEPEIQEGTTLTDWGNAVHSKNILARIKGTGSTKALLVLSHYDSAPHSFSKGASDDGSGIATILEGIRAFKKSNKKHSNDIIILFSDAEELGLNGAALFVTQHKWAKDVGLVLNFEARGTSGPGYMLMEVPNGNANMIQAFSDAHPMYAVTNSLMYSIYKMLPNDTDLTVFREKASIPGFNFAFIDHHFNYHTQQDDLNHLNTNSLEHQSTYFMPLLFHFSNANLNNLKSDADNVYFNIPFCILHYPFDWVLPMAIIAIALFLFLVIIGLGKRILFLNEIGKGFIQFISLLLIVGIIGFFGWKLILVAYPEYTEILQGFTYNGHDYIYMFLFLTLAICFLMYHKTKTEMSIMNSSIAPIFLWTLINLGLAIQLPGAGFFVIPVYFGLFQLGYYVYYQKTNPFLFLILTVSLLVLIAPFVLMFPVGLGLKILFGAMLLIVLIFGLGLPVFGHFAEKKIWGLICLILSLGFFISAHFNSDFEIGKAKPNSLNYVLNSDTQKAYWTTYDVTLDNWTENYLGKEPKKAKATNEFPLFSKYDSKFSFEANAPFKNIKKPMINFEKDTIIGEYRYLKIAIVPNRRVNRYDVFASEKMTLYRLKVNGCQNIDQTGNVYKRTGKRIVSYYVVQQRPLILEFAVNKKQLLDMSIMESSFDLLNNPHFSIPKRSNWMMPKPFVLNDAVVLVQKLKPSVNDIIKNTTVTKNIAPLNNTSISNK